MHLDVYVVHCASERKNLENSAATPFLFTNFGKLFITIETTTKIAHQADSTFHVFWFVRLFTMRVRQIIQNRCGYRKLFFWEFSVYLCCSSYSKFVVFVEHSQCTCTLRKYMKQSFEIEITQPIATKNGEFVFVITFFARVVFKCCRKKAPQNKLILRTKHSMFT